MEASNFSTSFLVDQTPDEVYAAINNVGGWWSEDFKGTSQNTGDEFEVRFGDVHYSRHKLMEMVPGEKVVWLVTDSELNFLEDKTEWNGTTNIFEISRQGDQTLVFFTHVGLVPQIQCFKDCSKGWNYFLHGSLFPFITTGTGKPHITNTEPAIN